MDLALNQQWLICHKTKPNQTRISQGLVGFSIAIWDSQIHTDTILTQLEISLYIYLLM